MRATSKYDELTGRTIGGKALEWMSELIERWGDERVAVALEEVVTSSGKLDKLLSRTTDHLARQGLASRRRTPPPEFSGTTMLDVARDEIPEPTRPYVYDLRDLNRDEYTEFMAWKEHQAEAR